MIKKIKYLLPIYRTLAGSGTRKTLDFFERQNSNFKRLKFKTNQKVFDWKVPHEWEIKDSFIQNIKTKKKYAEFKNDNLHVVGYSKNIDKIMSLNNLKKKIYTSYDLKNAIPYVTSYYSKDWGICMSENEKKKLPSGNYRIKIDSSFKKGFMEMSHAVIKGKSKKEIMFSSYVCHPSMVNNELSGPILSLEILNYLKKNFKNNYYTYRFLLAPETIGSIAYLSKYKNQLKKNVICGFNLTCVGDEKFYSHISSPDNNNLSDIAIKSSIYKFKNSKFYNFLERGSDEKQYCFPNIDLPFSTFCKSKFGTFKEYHTNKDNLNFVTKKGMSESFEIFKNIIQAFEMGIIPKNNKTCEPFLSKYKLYPTVSFYNPEHNKEFKKNLKTLRDIMAFSNEKKNIFEITFKINKTLLEVIRSYKLLIEKKLIKTKFI
jgi:aminopeptidase-like protein